MHRSEGATVLLAMPGLVVGAQVEVDGEWWLHVETSTELVGCAMCGIRAVGHGRRRVLVRDLPIAGRPVVLVWSKRVWRCPEPDCPTKTWSETTDAIAARASLTRRAGEYMCERVRLEEDSVAAVARDFGVGWHTAMAAVRAHGQPLVEDPARLHGVASLGLDETVFLHAGSRRRTTYVTGFVDLDRALLLDVRPGRSGKAVADWLDERGGGWREAIGVVALDPFRGYANGLVRRVDHATVVLDHFHAIRLANEAINHVRRRSQNETLGHRGRRADPLYDIRRLLLVGHERLDEPGWARLQAGLIGDRWGEVEAAYLAKELLREVYGAAGPRQARRRLERFYRWCTDAEVPELARLASTIRDWQGPVLAYHTTGMSNGPTEAVNLLIEKVRRIGHGFRNLDNYRLRLLLRCGVEWKTPLTARIRGRQPRFVA